jgi:tetratricopeptide (TPR) repeat protein
VPVVQAEDELDWYMKGENAVTIGKYSDAVTCYNNAISLNQKYAAAFSGKSYALNQLADFSGALDMADQALTIKDDVRALNQRAYALFKLQRYNESVIAYDKLFTLQTNLAETYCNQGMAYDELNQKEKAIAAFDHCTRLDPKNLDGWNRKGLALLSVGRYQDALDSFGQCTQITINNAEVWNNKGLAYGALGDYNNALVCFKRAISIDPNYSDAKQNLEKTFKQEPFFTPTATVSPKGTATIQKTPPPATTVTTPAQVNTSLTLLPSTEVPTESLPVAKTTNTPVSPWGAIIGIGIISLLVIWKKQKI